ncbi:tagaturonate reductase [soil metagenome]
MSGGKETVLQFGAGRFLRGFIDRFIQHANDDGQDVGKVVVVQTTAGPRADLLNQQPDGYHVLVRGLENGSVVERPEKIQSVSRALLAAKDLDQILQVTLSADLRYIVTNSTESGFVLDAGDRLESTPPRTMPGLLTLVLWKRYEAHGSPLVLLPCELIERNAERLRELVLTQARQWNLEENFQRWLQLDCVWLNSLVDCIITDPPADLDSPHRGDKLLVCAEPYALWALERPAKGMPDLFTDPAQRIVDDLKTCFLPKVRILNGIHTIMVAMFYPKGFQTVQQVLKDPGADRWIRDVLFEEIVPTIAYRLDRVAQFADQTLERMRNPFQAHKLSDIALNHYDKVTIRLKSTAQEYEKLFGKSPAKLAEAIAAKPV